MVIVSLVRRYFFTCQKNSISGQLKSSSIAISEIGWPIDIYLVKILDL